MLSIAEEANKIGEGPWSEELQRAHKEPRHSFLKEAPPRASAPLAIGPSGSRHETAPERILEMHSSAKFSDQAARAGFRREKRQNRLHQS